MACHRNLSRVKPAKDRTPKLKEVLPVTERTYQSKCRRQIQKHHEDLKDDPERLTTEFLVKICKCNCSRQEDDEDEP